MPDPEKEHVPKNPGGDIDPNDVDQEDGGSTERIEATGKNPGPEGTPPPDSGAPDGAGSIAGANPIMCPTSSSGSDANDPPGPSDSSGGSGGGGGPLPGKRGPTAQVLGTHAGMGLGAAPTGILGAGGVNWSFRGNANSIGNLVPELVYRSRVEFDGAFGKNWDFTLSQRVFPVQAGTMAWSTGEGRVRTFVASGAGTYASAPVFRQTLRDFGPSASPRYTITDKFGTAHEFDGAGRLTAIRDRWNHAVTSQYDASGRLSVTTDARGCTLNFNYYNSGRLKTIDDSKGRRTLLHYDNAGDLVRVGWWDPQSNVTRYRQLSYTSGSSDDRLNHNLVSITDFQGQPEYTRAYGTSGATYDRVTTSQTTGGRNYQYSIAGVVGVNSTTTVSLGGVPQYDYHFVGGALVDEGALVNLGGQGTTRLETRFGYNPAGELTSVVHPNGRRHEYTRDAVGNVTALRVKATDTTNNSTDDLVRSYTYEPIWNQVLTATDENGVTTSYQYDATGLRTQVTQPISATVNAVTSFTWNQNAQLTSVTDPDGVQTTYEYFASGPARDLLSTVRHDPSGANLRFALYRGPAGEVTGVREPSDEERLHTYDAWGQPLSTTDALGHQVLYQRDLNGRTTQLKVENRDPDGVLDASVPWIRTNRIFNPAGHVTAESRDIDGSTTATTAYTYDDRRFLDTVTAPEGGVTRYEYEERGYVSKVTLGHGSPVAGNWQYAYDAVGQLTRITDPQGKAWQQLYDAFGRMTQALDPLGTKVVAVHDRRGQALERRIEDAAGAAVEKTEYVYDRAGRVTQVRRHEFGPGLTPTVRTTSFTRTAGGRLTRIDYPDGLFVTFTYDAAGRPLDVTDALGNTVHSIYGADGRLQRRDVIEMENGTPKTYSMSFTHDALGRLIRTDTIDATNPQHVVSRYYRYDSRGNLRSTSGAGGPAEAFVYDALGRLLEHRTDPAGLNEVVRTTYDRDGRLTAYRDPSGNVTGYAYNARGQVTSTAFPGGGTAQFQYDGRGNVVSQTDPLGTVTQSAYDDAGRLIHRAITRAAGVLGSTFEDFVWDPRGNLVDARNDVSIVQYTYDSLNRVLTETQAANPAGATGKTVGYTYSAGGDLASLTYPSGQVLSIQRDALRRVTALTAASGGTLATLGYTGSSRRAQETYGNGTQSNFQWDGLGRVSTISHSGPAAPNFYNVAFTYRDDGSLLAEQRLHQGGAGDVYQYLANGRLSSVAYGVPNPAAEIATPGSQPAASRTNYAFDATGNRTLVSVFPGGGGPPVLTTYASNALNEYINVGGTPRAYNLNGNLSATPTTTYAYDFQNHLIQATANGQVVGAYQYDALGRRIGRTTSAGTSRYVYAGKEILEAYDGSGALTARYSYLREPDGRISYEARDWSDVNGNGNTVEWLRFYYHTDIRGSVVSVTDPLGAVVESYTYDVYGQPTILDRFGQQATASPIRNDFLFTGREWDAETGLYHFRARAYDPATGSFLQRDPISYADGPHLHQYVGANPTNLVDPYGLKAAPDGASGEKGKEPTSEAQEPWVPHEPPQPPPPWTPSEPTAEPKPERGRLAGAMQDALDFIAGVGRTCGEVAAAKVAGFTGESTQHDLARKIESLLPIPRIAKELGGDPNSLAGSAGQLYGTAPAAAACVAFDLLPAGVLTKGVSASGKLADGASKAARAYSVAYETTISSTGVGSRGAHNAAANTALLSQMKADTQFASAMETLGVRVPVSKVGEALQVSPKLWSWHHVPGRPGVMQLVPMAQHRGAAWQSLLHPGGRGGFFEWGSRF